MWEYVIVAVIVGWAGYYLWKTLFRKKGCSCSSKGCLQSNGTETKSCCSGQTAVNPLSSGSEPRDGGSSRP